MKIMCLPTCEIFMFGPTKVNINVFQRVTVKLEDLSEWRRKNVAIRHWHS